MNITGLLFCCWLRSRSSCSSLVGCGFVCASFVESLCGRLRLRGSFLASWLMVRGRCHRSTGRWFATKCSASVSGVCSATIVASTARRCSPIPLCDALDSAPSQWTFTSRPVWLQLKIFVTFTRNFPSRVLMTLVSFCMHAGCSSRAFEFYVAWGFLFTCSCAHSLSTECGRLVDLALCLVWWNFLAALVLSLSVCCRLEILQHLTWRLSGCLLEVCIIASGDELRSARGRTSIYSRPCCESSSGPYVLTFALLESLQFAAWPQSSHRQEVSRTSAFHLDIFSWRTWDANFGLKIEITLSLCEWASVSGSKTCIPILLVNWIDPNSLFHELAVRWRNGNHRSNSLFHDLVVFRFDRVDARQTPILFLVLHIAHVHGLFWLNFGLECLSQHVNMSFTVREAKLNSLIGFPSPSLSVSHINNYLCSDSAGILMCSVSWIIFSWVTSTFVFSLSHWWFRNSQFLIVLTGCCCPTKSCPPLRRHLRGSAASRIGSATMWVYKCLSALVSWKHICRKILSLSWCRLSVVVSWKLLRSTHGLPFWTPVYRGCPVWTHQCATVQGDSVAKRQPIVRVEWSRDIVCSVRSCSNVPRSCATESTHKTIKYDSSWSCVFFN